MLTSSCHDNFAILLLELHRATFLAAGGKCSPRLVARCTRSSLSKRFSSFLFRCAHFRLLVRELSECSCDHLTRMDPVSSRAYVPIRRLFFSTTRDTTWLIPCAFFAALPVMRISRSLFCFLPPFSRLFCLEGTCEWQPFGLLGLLGGLPARASNAKAPDHVRPLIRSVRS